MTAYEITKYITSQIALFSKKNLISHLSKIFSLSLPRTKKLKNMRRIVLLILLSVFMSSKAQNIVEPEEPYDYYCIVIVGNWSKAYIIMPFSEFRHAIMNEEGKKKSFNNEAEILTYMSKHGWKYVESITYDKNSAYIMKKTVRSDNEAKGELILEYEIEQKKKD